MLHRMPPSALFAFLRIGDAFAEVLDPLTMNFKDRLALGIVGELAFGADDFDVFFDFGDKLLGNLRLENSTAGHFDVDRAGVGVQRTVEFVFAGIDGKNEGDHVVDERPGWRFHVCCAVDRPSQAALDVVLFAIDAERLLLGNIDG